MRSARVIATLTADLQPVRVRSSRRDLLTLAGIGAVEVALFVAIGSTRPDLRAAAMSPVLWWKLTTLAVVAGIGVVGAVRSFAPDRLPRDRRGTAISAGIGAAAWGAFVFALARPSDDPLYIMCWYVLGCGVITLATRRILSRAIRWWIGFARIRLQLAVPRRSPGPSDDNRSEER